MGGKRVNRGTHAASWLLGGAAAGAGAVAVTGVALAARGVRAALGGRPDSAALAGSPQFRDGAFRNPAPPRWLPPGSGKQAARELLFGGQPRHPAAPVPLVVPSGPAPAEGLHITWFGHASSLVELDGARVLLDPVWSDRVSPSRLVGPRRLHPVPHRIDDLPPVDAIVISHDHYDHLDMPTVLTLARTQRAPFVVPLGVGAHLRAWQVPESRIVELDWGDETEAGGLRIVATPAQHFSGRGFERNNTLWASWVIAGERHRVFYSGDTGHFDGFTRIGEQYGPFDATLVQIGAYAPSWPDIHMTPEEGVATHLDVRGGLMIPVHWATFNLAPHAWSEPVDRAWQEAKARGVTLAVPRPGERIDVAAPPQVDGWWTTLS
ncbi:MBL fold metallo-hydrolase [Prauserella muralis]|uniref:Zn-dependent hydrolase n=1 Tax=Prauserella muralis TaxID=588067 RepID=A0A2V4B114_9PSEU|nr:MBL fold metallo-hydrolase [Prauserella muralis]PXY27960.1 Zn-dependent hydrolase [Prauserella muralis]TWE22253.1 L-ascorbate metabolism protein UlaG (beta-lactamase superfamily) [Prauserella muralis]